MRAVQANNERKAKRDKGQNGAKGAKEAMVAGEVVGQVLKNDRRTNQWTRSIE